jgi:diaminopimelate epimerase
VDPAAGPLPGAPSVVNVGNPHAIFWVDDVAAWDLARLGPLLEHHPIFPERANISLARVTGESAITLRTWERGAGLTRACGSAACAAAVAAARNGLTGRQVTVTLPGGDLAIDWRSDGHILMTGPVEVEHEGMLDLTGAEAALAPREPA